MALHIQHSLLHLRVGSVGQDCDRGKWFFPKSKSIPASKRDWTSGFVESQFSRNSQSISPQPQFLAKIPDLKVGWRMSEYLQSQYCEYLFPFRAFVGPPSFACCGIKFAGENVVWSRTKPSLDHSLSEVFQKLFLQWFSHNLSQIPCHLSS